MSMFDNLKSKLGIDTEADSYIDDTEDEIFAGGQGAPQQDYEQPEVKQHSNKVVNINATTQLQVVLVKPERFEDASTIADQLNAKRTVVFKGNFSVYHGAQNSTIFLFFRIVCEPSKIMTDFEKSIIKACEEVYSNSPLSCWVFHFDQSIYRQIH